MNQSYPHYVSYIKPHELDAIQFGLGEQTPLTRAEQTFIRAHQIQELYLLQITTEIEAILGYLHNSHVPQGNFSAVARHFERAKSASRLMIDALDLLETLSPLEFQKFRPKFGTASGRESIRFRHFEALLGFHQEIKTEVDRLEAENPFPGGTTQNLYIRRTLGQIRTAMNGYNLKSALYTTLSRLPFPAHSSGTSHCVYPGEPTYSQAVQSYAENYVDFLRDSVGNDFADRAYSFFLADPNSQNFYLRLGALLTLTGVKLPLLAEPRRWLQGVLALEDAWFCWQTRHIITVRRTLGLGPGTGGTTGVPKLRENLERNTFAELHRVKTFVASHKFNDSTSDLFGYVPENQSNVVPLKPLR